MDQSAIQNSKFAPQGYSSSKIQNLFPAFRPGLAVDDLYTVPELSFPDEGVAMAGSGERRPYVYLNMVSSVDGRAVTAARSAEGLGSDTDRRLMHRLRLASDGVLVAAETFRRDPFMPTFNPDLAAERARYFPANAPQPWGIVVSSDGNLPLDKKFFQTGPKRRLVALGEVASAEREAAFQPYAQVVRVPLDESGHPDLKWLLVYLYREVGIRRLLSEGGPRLDYSLVAQNLADELFWTLAPTLVAAQTNSNILTGPDPGFSLDKMPRLQLVSLYEQASEMFLRYRIGQPQAA